MTIEARRNDNCAPPKIDSSPVLSKPADIKEIQTAKEQYPWLSSKQAVELVTYRAETPQEEGDMSTKEFSLIFPDTSEAQASEFAESRKLKYRKERLVEFRRRYSRSAERGMGFVPPVKNIEEIRPLASFVERVLFAGRYHFDGVSGSEIVAIRAGVLKPRENSGK